MRSDLSLKENRKNRQSERHHRQDASTTYLGAKLVSVRLVVPVQDSFGSPT